MGFFSPEGIGTGLQNDTGVFADGKIQQVYAFAGLRIIEEQFLVSLGYMDVFFPDFAEDLVGNRFGREFGRTPCIESLDQVDSAVNDGAEFLRRFDTLRQGADAVLMGEIDGVPDKETAVGIRRDSGDEAPVDLDDLGSIAQEVQNIGVAGTEIVNGDLRLRAGFADALEPVQLLVRRGVVLGEFESRVCRRA